MKPNSCAFREYLTDRYGMSPDGMRNAVKIDILGEMRINVFDNSRKNITENDAASFKAALRIDVVAKRSQDRLGGDIIG
jgi:hypothetical protein